MNYAVNSASSVNYSHRRPCTPTPFIKLLYPTLPTSVRRITINVGGERFQTYEETLARYPTSLLGSAANREKFHDFARDEFVFPQCNKEIFNAILFFYQAKILSRPDHVPIAIFAKEVRFFGLAGFCSEVPVEEIPETVTENNTFRNRLWNFLEYPRTQTGRCFSKFNLFLILLWVVVQCAETQIEPTLLKGSGTTNGSRYENEARDWMDSNGKKCGGCFLIIDTMFVVWFTIDYFVHLATAPKVIRYVMSPSGFVDLLTILPYYVEVLAKHSYATHSSSQLQILAFLRIFKFFKATRYSSSFRILVGSLTSSAHDLPMWVLLMFIHILFFSSIVFYVEWEFGNPQFSDIPETMWFIVITMCAVGYGDIVPKSIAGKIVTAFAAVSGIVIVFCIPAPTLKKNFNRLNELHKSKKKEQKNSKANVLYRSLLY